MRKRLPKNRLKPDSEKHIVEEFDEKEPIEKSRITGGILLHYISSYHDYLKVMFMCFFIVSFLLVFAFLFSDCLISLLLLVISIVFFCLYLKNKKKKLNLQEFYLEKHPLKGKYSRRYTDDDGEEHICYYFLFNGKREFRIDKNPMYSPAQYSYKRIFNSVNPGDEAYLLLKDKSKKVHLVLPEKFFEFEYEDFTEVEGRYYAIQEKAKKRKIEEDLERERKIELLREELREKFPSEEPKSRRKAESEKEKSERKSLPPELKKLKKSKKAFNVFAVFSLVALVFTVIGIFSEFIAIFNPFVQPVWLIIPMAVATIRLIISGSAIKKMPLISDDYDETKKKQKKLKRLNALLIISDFALYIAVWVVAAVFHFE